MSDLKPCPHCGESRAFVEDIDTSQGLKWYVFCFACGATGGYKFTIAKAIEAWNTRAERTCAKLPPITVQTCIVRRGGCEMEFGYWRCGECQCENFEGARYCMNCGAKVVEQ